MPPPDQQQLGATRSRLRSAVWAITAVAAAITCWIAATVAAAIAVAGTALIVPGTGTPRPSSVPGYMDNAVDYYIAPTTASCAVECTAVGVDYIAQFWPFPFAGWGGITGAKLDESVASGVTQLTSDLVGPYHPDADRQVVVFGYSQGATVASRQKSLLSKLPAETQSAISFVLIGNPNRPNGGLFERLAWFGTVPILDATFGLPTPTDTDMATVDIAFQYDGVADFPLYPLNLVATLNAVAGFWYTHGSMLSPNGRSPDELPNGLTPDELAAAIADPANQQRRPGSDTTYILIPTPNLPLLQPLRDFGAATGLEFITTPLIDAIQPPLRMLIEAGYDRSMPYSQPAPLRLIPPLLPGRPDTATRELAVPSPARHASAASAITDRAGRAAARSAAPRGQTGQSTPLAAREAIGEAARRDPRAARGRAA